MMKMRWIVGTGVLGLLLATSGCGESAPSAPGVEVLMEIEEGTLRSEVLERLPEGDLAEGSGHVRGYRVQRYLIDGETIEVLWLHRPGEGKAEAREADPRESLTPVIFRGVVLEGWGWERFERARERWSLASPMDPQGL